MFANSTIRRLARRGGVHRIPGLVADDTREADGSDNIFMRMVIPPSDLADIQATQNVYKNMCMAIAQKTLTDKQVHDALVENPLLTCFMLSQMAVAFSCC